MGLSWQRLTASRAGSCSRPCSVTFSSLEAGRLTLHSNATPTLLLRFCTKAGEEEDLLTESASRCGRPSGEGRPSYQLRQVGQVLGGDLASRSGFRQHTVSAIYLQTPGGTRYSPHCNAISLSLGGLGGRGAKTSSYRLDTEVCDVHQLVPLQRHRPDFSSECQVLHGEEAQVLDL